MLYPADAKLTFLVPKKFDFRNFLFWADVFCVACSRTAERWGFQLALLPAVVSSSAVEGVLVCCDF